MVGEGGGDSALLSEAAEGGKRGRAVAGIFWVKI